jgi:S-adenosylmethionine/arginine decarboxylase-like enzyme
MKHIVFTLYGCQSALLNDEDYIRKILWEATHHMGATFLKTTTHKFEPQGVTAVTLLADGQKNKLLCVIFLLVENQIQERVQSILVENYMHKILQHKV